MNKARSQQQEKPKTIQKLNNTLFNNKQFAKEIKKKNLKFLELIENENTTYQNPLQYNETSPQWKIQTYKDLDLKNQSNLRLER